MNLKIIALILIFLTLTGCSKTPEEVREAKTIDESYNKRSLQNPEKIGELSDGRSVNVVIIKRYNSAYPHYVYFVGDTTTVNHSVQAGKTQRNDVQAFFASKGISEEEVIEKSAILKKLRDEEDRAAYERYKAKLEKQQ